MRLNSLHGWLVFGAISLFQVGLLSCKEHDHGILPELSANPNAIKRAVIPKI